MRRTTAGERTAISKQCSYVDKHMVDCRFCTTVQRTEKSSTEQQYRYIDRINSLLCTQSCSAGPLTTRTYGTRSRCSVEYVSLLGSGVPYRVENLRRQHTANTLYAHYVRTGTYTGTGLTG